MLLRGGTLLFASEGKWSTTAASSMDKCEGCSPGQYITEDKNCAACPFGRVSEESSETCIACPDGTYANDEKKECLRCPSK